MRRRFEVENTPPPPEITLPDITVRVRSIIKSNGTIYQDKILEFSVKDGKATVRGNNPIVGNGDQRGEWSFELLTTEGIKSVTCTYSSWTVSNGDVWGREVTLTPSNRTASFNVRCSSLNLLNFNANIKSVEI